ncbi:MAG: hypothetical protein HY518_00315 [Candidatus Aenigmarchaeota archaeon]|nr:hypothetical protein [Candidatus Aenigmarchaeota archaeon]
MDEKSVIIGVIFGLAIAIITVVILIKTTSIGREFASNVWTQVAGLFFGGGIAVA